MASFVGKMAANKFLKGEAKKYVDKQCAGDQDPYFMIVEDPRTGKKKKVVKTIPSYIPEHDAHVLAKCRKRAYQLDMALFTIAGQRFGWSSVLGIIPGFGDAGDAALALLLVRKCSSIKCKLTTNDLIWMAINIIIDFVIGIIPILGDLLDGFWKANTKNVRILEERLDAVYKPQGDDTKIVWGKETNPRRPPPASSWEDFDSEDKERRDFVRQQNQQDVAQQAQPAATQGSKKNGRGGWLSGTRGAKQQPDVEMAQSQGAQPLSQGQRQFDQETGTVSNGQR